MFLSSFSEEEKRTAHHKAFSLYRHADKLPVSQAITIVSIMHVTESPKSGGSVSERACLWSSLVAGNTV